MWFWTSPKPSAPAPVDDNIYEIGEYAEHEFSDASKLTALQEEQERLEATIRRKADAHEAALKKHQAELSFQSRQLRQKEEKLAALEDDIAQKVEKLEKSRVDNCSSLDEKIQELRSKINDANAAFAETTEELASIKSQIASAQTREKEREANERRREEEASRELKGKTSDLSRLETQLREAEANSKRLQTQMDALRSELNTRVGEAGIAQQQIAEQIAVNERMLEDALASAKRLREERRVEAENCERAQNLVCEMESGLKDLKKELEEAEANLEKQRRQDKEARKAAKTELTQIKTELMEAQSTHAALCAKLSSVNREREAGRKKRLQELEGLQANVKGAEMRCATAGANAAALRERVKAAEEANAAALQEMEDLRARNEELMSELAKAEATAAAAKLEPPSPTAEADKIMANNPCCIPVRCERAEGCSLPLLAKKRFAVPRTMQLQNFAEHIRVKLGLSRDDQLNVFVHSTACVPDSKVLFDIFEECRARDGFLDLRYSN
eukprot:TRINITY_DN6074_c0_g1_i1.p1 TRINITY_DN6074_c0_g1~~TRINITY_DN6074_c0_g1_i1.p1  ORF type:complete len:502 (+),score=111.56 TRINITY_DN6074_c0_g1_i1:45-1550(+)